MFCSNTSGLSITEMASATKRPAQVIVTHFFNPVPIMELVEIIRGNSFG
ncbi:3-hydroxyacyl-CoA dehydrogenase NAD-binding domain-containing protein [Brevibacillus sp. NRS-1366]